MGTMPVPKLVVNMSQPIMVSMLVQSILSSLLFVLWGVFGTKAFIRQFSQDEAIVAYGTTYLKICQIFAAGIFLGTFTQRLLQSPPAGPSPVCWRRWRALWPSL